MVSKSGREKVKVRKGGTYIRKIETIIFKKNGKEKVKGRQFYTTRKIKHTK